MRSLIAIAMLLSSSCYAGDWYITTALGTTMGGSADYILRSSSGVPLATAEVDQSVNLAAEVSMGTNVSHVADIELTIGYSTFGSNLLNGTDSVVTAILTPKMSVYYNDNLNIWAGAGIGVAFSGHNSSYTDSTGIMKATGSAASLLLSPRIGFDVPVFENSYIGLQLDYSITSYKNLTGTVTSGSTTSPLKIDVSRQTWGAMVRYGFVFESGK